MSFVFLNAVDYLKHHKMKDVVNMVIQTEETG